MRCAVQPCANDSNSRSRQGTFHESPIPPLCAAPSLPLGARWVSGHEGHDPDAAPLPAGVSIAPRAEATSDAFELIAIAEGGELAIYLDRFATNEPFEGA